MNVLVRAFNWTSINKVFFCSILDVEKALCDNKDNVPMCGLAG